MKDKFLNRYSSLINETDLIENSKYVYETRFGDDYKVDNNLLLTWKVKVKNLISLSCGENSQHFKEFLESEKSRDYQTNYSEFNRMKSVLSAAYDDYKNGFVVSVKNLILSEVFDSELEQASELIKHDYHIAAAVITGVVLETALRDICKEEGIKITKFDRMNAELVKVGRYGVNIQKKITAIAGLRNSAAHGKTSEFTKKDVSIMIQDAKNIIENHLY